MGFELTRRAAMALGALGLTGVAAQAANPTKMTVQLNGQDQVPPVQTNGTGTADLTYDPSTRKLTWDITYQNLTSPATMAHIHGPAGPRQNGPVLVWLSKKGAAPSSPITGSATLTPDQAKMLMAGQTYINVHSKDHPSGEIRGQITPSQTS